MTGLRDGTPEEAGLSASRLACASELAASFVEHDDHPALVVLVARHGVVALHEAFGTLGPEPDAPALPRDALFPLASVAKPITATATMVLVEEGRIGLTRPVRDYLPEFRGGEKNHVYVHQLLTHTSGIQSDIEEWVRETAARPERPDRDPAVHPTADVALQLAYERPLRTTPGEEMYYDNFNYELLAEIVRRVSGRPFEHFVQERIFDPLGMTDSHAIVPKELLGRVVRATPESPMGWAWGEPLPAYAAGCSGFLSTALDIATFGQAFLDGGRAGAGRILGPATVREMTTNQIPGVPGALMLERHDEASWGYGWGIDCGERWSHSPTFPRGTFWHSGITGVGLWRDPTNDLVDAFFSAMTKEQRPNVGLLQSDLFVNAVTAAIDD